MMDVNRSVGEIVQSIRADKAKELPKFFTFNVALDQVGPPLEHPAYVKRSCNKCYGRGYQTFLIGDGYRVRKVKDDKGYLSLVKERHPDRLFRACPCVNNGYIRARKELDQEIADLVESGVSVDKAKVAALKAVLPDHGTL